MRTRLLEKGLAPKSASMYARRLRDIEAFVGERGFTLRNVTGDVIADYAERCPKSWSTRKEIRNALRHAWEIMGRRNPPLWAVRVPRKPRMRCRALDPAAAAQLAEAARDAAHTTEGLAVLLGLYLGLRRAEIATLRWEDFVEDGWVRVTGKGGVVADLPLHACLREPLERRRTRAQGPYVFPRPGHPDQPCTGMTVYNHVARASRSAGIGRVNPHRLRHTCLTEALERTEDLRAVQEFARHADPQTTAGYTRVASRRLVKVVVAIEYRQQEPPEAVAVPA